MMNWKGCGRKLSWPNIKELSQNLPGGTEENTNKTSVRIAGLQAEISNRDPPNTKQECC
jgi:hypothetical protein